ncbi:MAG: undecaprenyldiphospho-muramoylpentapeptide beta-N-acetylglucosaminyltransferase [Bacillota bacterium]
MKRLIVTGGGTGGHVYPALSIAREFLARGPGRRVLYVGARRGLESTVIPEAGIPFRALRVEGFLGRGAAGKARSLLLLASALREAGGILAEFAPDVVVGTGGYVSVPVVMRAQLARIPTLIQEQNVLSGAANRMLSHLARAVAAPAVEAAGNFPRRVQSRLVVTGNPVRRDVISACRSDGRAQYGLGPGDVMLLVVGGSGGARTINRGTLDFVLDHLPEHPHLRVLWVTGPRYHEEVLLRLESAGAADRVRVMDYLRDMPSALAACDLLLCRGGAMSLAEAAAAGRPMIIVPSPNVTHNHQQHNARALEGAGAAVVIPDCDFTGDSLQRVISGLLDDCERMRAMAGASAARGRPGALDEIMELIEGLARGGAR